MVYVKTGIVIFMLVCSGFIIYSWDRADDGVKILNEDDYNSLHLIPEDPSDKFIGNLQVGEYAFYEPSNLYYTKLANGNIMATGGENAEKNIKIEIEARK